MDQHKKDQGQQNQGSNQQFQRDPAEGSRENVNTGTGQQQHDANRQQERGSGQQGERNRGDQGGISNRGMGRSQEQQDVPGRGRNRESDR